MFKQKGSNKSFQTDKKLLAIGSKKSEGKQQQSHKENKARDY